MKINPDFVTVDDIRTPANLKELCGWTTGDVDEQDAIRAERIMFDELQKDMPIAMKQREARSLEPIMLEKWNKFQADKGRYPGSNDLSLLDEFIIGKDLAWLPQLIGSCVISNTFRGYVSRMMYEIILEGQGEEYLGRDEFGPSNFSFYAPWSYGMARRRANMRGGDGLYCKPMVESLMKDGVLPCDTPKLVQILERAGSYQQKDFPETQSKQLYRQFGDWSYLDELQPYADFNLLECPMVTSEQQLWDLQMAGKPTFVCSMEAIHKVGEHKDGFPIHAYNPRDSWAHNMGVNGAFVASDGDEFYRWNNKSWGKDHLYNRPRADVEKAFRAGRLTMAAIGEINGPRSSAPMIA